jgi:murein DD-endopeptidase MepM/ murein hydrolase activator NlpD
MKHHRIGLGAAALLFCITLSAAAGAVHIDYPDRVTQGEVYLVTLSGDDTVFSARGFFAGRSVYFNPTGVPGTLTGIMGVDLGAAPEVKTLALTIKKNDGTLETVTKSITVVKGNFSVQRLALDRKWVSYDEATLKRIQHEAEISTALYATESPRRLWTEPFVMPLIGGVTTSFGMIRYVNDQPPYQHDGIDISAVTGTPVSAANDGKVALVMDRYLSGLSLFIDHGQGLYTTYYHLSEVLVTEGELVKRGQIVALVGATGRVTGAHLHFGARLNYNRINPAELVGKRLR